MPGCRAASVGGSSRYVERSATTRVAAIHLTWLVDEPPLGSASSGIWEQRDSALPLVRRPIDALDAYPFLYRYAPEATDGFAGRQGAFLPVSFWAVTARALIGDLPGAVAQMDALCTMLPRLLSEEMDPVELTALGNAPLLWSHAERPARCMYWTRCSGGDDGDGLGCGPGESSGT